MFTPVVPPDSPCASSKVIVATTRALTVKFWLKATFPGSTASSPIAIVMLPALPAVTLSVHIFAPLDDNVFAVPFVMLMSVSKKSVMSMSEATVKVNVLASANVGVGCR